jgi:RNA-directed DNA polymerase
MTVSDLSQVINTAHIYQGLVICSRYGIPRRSSLSPFFGALYLSVLDKYFEKAHEIYYVRYMDDWVILCETKRQYVRAKKKMRRILNALKLKLSPHKTKMGALTKGFHFLGVDFALSQNAQSRTHVDMTLHQRSCRRALDKVSNMKEGAVHPAEIQRYLFKWAAWWSCTVRL